MIIAICDQNECNYGIKIDDASTPEVLEKVKRFMEEGHSAWYCATHPEDWDDETYFTREEVECMYNDGYSEAACELLERENIPYETVDLRYDDDGDVTNADEVIWW